MNTNTNTNPPQSKPTKNSFVINNNGTIRRRRFRRRLPPRLRAAKRLNRILNNPNNAPKNNRKSKRKNNVSRPVASKGVMNNPYAMCRLMPFKSQGKSLGIPDGTDLKRILIDHRMQNTFTIGSSGGVNIAITPALPSSIWFQTPAADTEFRCNSLHFPYHTGDDNVMFPIMQPEWRHLPVALRNIAGVFDNAPALYGTTKSRIVTVGWSILYTGTSLNNSGLIKVNRAQLSANTLQPNPEQFHVLNSQAGTDKTWEHDQVLVRKLEVRPAFYASNTFDTRTFPLRTGCNGVLKHSADEYEWNTVSSDLAFISTPVWEKNSFLAHNNLSSEGTAEHWPSIASFDNGWASTLITISGAAPGSSFVLDTLYCVEYAPSISADVYALAKAGPDKNENLINKVTTIASKQPIAQSGDADSFSVGDVIVPMLKTGMKIAGSMIV